MGLFSRCSVTVVVNFATVMSLFDKQGNTKAGFFGVKSDVMTAGQSYPTGAPQESLPNGK